MISDVLPDWCWTHSLNHNTGAVNVFVVKEKKSSILLVGIGTIVKNAVSCRIGRPLLVFRVRD